MRQTLKSLYLTHKNVQIEEVKVVKFLWIQVQNILIWTDHVTDLSGKIMKMAGQLGKLPSLYLMQCGVTQLRQK